MNPEALRQLQAMRKITEARRVPPGPRLHLGCGDVRLDDYTNVDFHTSPAVDTACDLSRRWPWEDDSVAEIYSNHCFEHLAFPHPFLESYRVLKPGGLLRFGVPHGNTYVYLLNPTHVARFSSQSFDAWRHDGHGSDYGIHMRWKVERVHISIFGRSIRGNWFRNLANAVVNPLVNAAPLLYERFFMYWLPAAHLEFNLRKPQ